MPDDTLRILCWEGYETDAILQPFRERYGIEASGETLISDADTAQRLANGEAAQWDVLNINNAYVKKHLHPHGLIKPLNASRFEPHFDTMLSGFDQQYSWALDETGQHIGICQRFGAFNLVINTRRISVELAEDQGFELANNTEHRGRFGILLYEDFNIFHICIGSGLNPFIALDNAEQARYGQTALDWFGNAAIVTDDHHALNRALVEGRIDFYLSGGVYTVSPARLEGHTHLRAITPRNGPIDGRGGIAFTEITSVLAHSNVCAGAEDFLEYLLEPETASRIAFVSGTCNPVAQMGDERVRKAFTAKQLDAIQWDTLEEDVGRCADYDIVPNHSALLAQLRKAVAACQQQK